MVTSHNEQLVDLGSTSKGEHNVSSKPDGISIKDNSKIVIHGLDGPYLMEREKWPKLTLPDEWEYTKSLTQEESLMISGNLIGGSMIEPMSPITNVEALETDNTIEEDIMDVISNLSKDSDMEVEGKVWQTSKSMKGKKRKFKQLVVATRTSDRLPRDGVPIVEKASARAAAKNNISGMQYSSNPFTILNSTPTAFLQSVMNDHNIVMEDAKTQIDTFREEQLVRAAIAEANYKAFLDK